jgi:hypothetical protein
MASIEWKEAKWEAYRGSLSVPELLTVLKGFGSMEILKFEVPGRFAGLMSLCLTDDGTKEVTLYHLEVLCEKCHGVGRKAVRWLKEIFRGPVFLEFPDSADPEIGFHPTLPFWLKMYREGLVDAIDCENFYLEPKATSDQVDEFQDRIVSALNKGPKILK